MQHLSAADLWAMCQYCEKNRIAAQKSYDLYKSREFAANYETKLNYWIDTLRELYSELGRRVNEVNPMYPQPLP